MRARHGYLAPFSRPASPTRDTTARGPCGASRAGAWGLARIVRLITSAVVGLIVIGIVLVLFEANRDNAIVDWLVGAAHWLVGPFDDVFKPDGHKARVAINWGLAAVLYAIVGGMIARLLRR